MALALVLCACQQGGRQPAPAGPAARAVTSTTIDETPCGRARVARKRVPALVVAGKVARAVRVIEAADAACPAERSSTLTELELSLAALGRDASPTAAKKPAGARDEHGGTSLRQARASQRAGDLVAAEREALMAWVLERPYGEALAFAGLIARARGDEAEAQRRFDRALVELRSETGASPRIVASGDALPTAERIVFGEDTEAAAVAFDAPTTPVNERKAGILLLDKNARNVRRWLDAEAGTQVVFTDSGRTLVASVAGGIDWIDADTGRRVRRVALPEVKHGVWSLSADGSRIVVVGERRAFIVDVSTGKPTLSFAAGAAHGAVWSPRGDAFALLTDEYCSYPQCGGDQSWTNIEIHGALRGERRRTIMLKDMLTTELVRFTADGARVIVTDHFLGAAHANVFDVATGRSLATVQAAEAAGNRDDALIEAMWQEASGARGWPEPARVPIELAIVNQSALVLRTRDDLRAWSLSNNDELWTRAMPSTGTTHGTGGSTTHESRGVFSPDRGRFLVAREASIRLVEAIDLASGTTVGLARGSCFPVTRMATDMHGEHVATACPFGPEITWGSVSHGSLVRLDGAKERVSGLSLGPDGRTIARTGNDRQTWLWTNANEAHAPVPFADPAEGYAASFSPDGSALALARGRGALELWDVAARKMRWRVELPRTAHALAFSPDGAEIVASADEESTLLTSRDGAVIARLPGTADEDLPATFVAGRNVLLVGERSGRLSVVRADGRRLGWIETTSHGRGGIYFDEGGWVELLGGANDLHALTCRVGTVGLPFEVCAEELVVPGLLARRLAGDTSPPAP
jgi:hypothetical protein